MVLRVFEIHFLRKKFFVEVNIGQFNKKDKKNQVNIILDQTLASCNYFHEQSSNTY